MEHNNNEIVKINSRFSDKKKDNWYKFGSVNKSNYKNSDKSR